MGKGSEIIITIIITIIIFIIILLEYHFLQLTLHSVFTLREKRIITVSSHLKNTSLWEELQIFKNEENRFKNVFSFSDGYYTHYSL